MWLDYAQELLTDLIVDKRDCKVKIYTKRLSMYQNETAGSEKWASQGS